jgi:hypothetical protein
MHKNNTKCNKTQSKWCINKHGASKIIDTFETYHLPIIAFLLFQVYSSCFYLSSKLNFLLREN